MNQNLVMQSKNLYQQLAMKLHLVQIRLSKVIDESIKTIQVLEILQEYSIRLEDVIHNVMKYFNIIRQAFDTRKCKSISAVAVLITTLQKNIREYKGEESSVQKSSLLLLYEYNLKAFVEMLDSIWLYEDDIRAFKISSNPEFILVYQKIKIRKNFEPQRSDKQYQFLTNLLLTANAAVINSHQFSNSFIVLLAFIINFPRFAISSETALLKTNVFLRDPKIKIMSQIWNLTQKGLIGMISYLHLDSIQTSRVLYISKNSQTLSLEQVQDYIPVRLIYNQEVPFVEQTNWRCLNNQGKQINEIILHFHGGGFVSLSSSSTQSYTRKWAKGLNIPVLSVDYSMAPQNRFPAAIQDALAVYKFVVFKLSSFCNINPKRIVLAGDSAGGNIACSLMGLILKEKLPLPCGIFMAYPACNLNVEYSPSRQYSFFNPVFHTSLLRLCTIQYLGPQFLILQNHPLASPLYLTNQFVYNLRGDYRFPSNWPKTRIIVGDKDPLFDDSLRLCQRMVHSGIDVLCSVYENHSHGFLSLEKFVAGGLQSIIQSIAFIADLFA